MGAVLFIRLVSSAIRVQHSECPTYSGSPHWELPGSFMGAALVFYNLVQNHQLAEDFVGGLWGPGEFQSQRSSLDPFQQGRRNSRWVLAQVPWTGPEEGLEDWSGQQNPLNPCLGPFPPWSGLSATNLLWDFVQKASSIWASVSPAVIWEAWSCPPGAMRAWRR